MRSTASIAGVRPVSNPKKSASPAARTTRPSASTSAEATRGSGVAVTVTVSGNSMSSGFRLSSGPYGINGHTIRLPLPSANASPAASAL